MTHNFQLFWLISCVEEIAWCNGFSLLEWHCTSWCWLYNWVADYVRKDHLEKLEYFLTGLTTFAVYLQFCMLTMFTVMIWFSEIMHVCRWYKRDFQVLYWLKYHWACITLFTDLTEFLALTHKYNHGDRKCAMMDISTRSLVDISI